MAKPNKSSLLEGNIRKQLIVLALPLLVGCLLQQLYNTVDALIVGRFLGEEAFAAIGVSGTVMNLFIFALNGFCVGAGILFGQSYGAGNRDRFRKAMFTGLSFGAGITVATSLLSICLMRPILRLLSTPAELESYCSSYLTVILSGLICTYLYNLLSSILRSMGDTKAATFFLFLSVLGNFVLDTVFIAVLKLGVAAAAAATVIAQLFSVLCCTVYITKKYPEYIFKKADVGFYKDILTSIMKLGLVSALQQCSLYLGKMLVQGAVNTLGTSGIAAYTAATKIEGFANSFGDSCGQSVSIFISQNYGAGNLKRLREGFRTGLGLLIGLGVFFGALMFLLARTCIPIFLTQTSEEILTEGCNYLHLIAFFYFLCFMGNCNVGFFRGTGKVLIAFCCTTMHLTVRVIFSYLLVGSMGLRAVALGTGIGWVLCVATQLTIHSLLWKRHAFDKNADA